MQASSPRSLSPCGRFFDQHSSVLCVLRCQWAHHFVAWNLRPSLPPPPLSLPRRRELVLIYSDFFQSREIIAQGSQDSSRLKASMIVSGGVASERFCWRVEVVLGLRGAVVVRALIVVSSRVCRAPDSWFLMSRRAVKNSEIGAPGLGTIS